MGIVFLSLVIAVVAATVALWLAFNLRGNLQRFGSALVMGVAVCGMHDTGMAAVTLLVDENAAAVTSTSLALSNDVLAFSIFTVTTVILSGFLLISTIQAQVREEVVFEYGFPPSWE